MNLDTNRILKLALSSPDLGLKARDNGCKLRYVSVFDNPCPAHHNENSFFLPEQPAPKIPKAVQRSDSNRYPVSYNK